MRLLESELGDVHQLITADGNSIAMPDGELVLKAYGNYGLPPVEWITRKGYQQDGVTEIAYNLNPRTVSIDFYRKKACSRSVYWANRTALLDILRHNRNGALTLILTEAGGNKRALTVRVNSGADFPPAPDNNSWAIDAPIELIAFDPLWFDPVASSTDVALTVDSNLIFPITFPITFGINGAQFNHAITYTGTWRTYPTLTLTGPYTSALITNLQTGVYLELTQGCIEGDSRIITLTPGMQSVKDAAGNNKFTDLSAASNLVDFNIRPDPEVTDGIQTIRAIFQGARVYRGTGWLVQSQILDPDRWYRMDDTNTTCVDLGGDGASGTYQGTYTQSVAGALSGDPDKATSFNGTTGTVTIVPTELQGISYTISGWVNTGSVVGAPALYGVNGGAGAYQRLIFGLSATRQLIADFGGGVTFTSAANAYTLSAYSLLTLTYDKPTGILKGYINKVEVFSGTASDFAAAAPTCYIGSFNAASNFVNGSIDEVQIWRGVALSAANVGLLYDSRTLASRTYSPSGFNVSYNSRYIGI